MGALELAVYMVLFAIVVFALFWAHARTTGDDDSAFFFGGGVVVLVGALIVRGMEG